MIASTTTAIPSHQSRRVICRSLPADISSKRGGWLLAAGQDTPPENTLVANAKSDVMTTVILKAADAVLTEATKKEEGGGAVARLPFRSV